MYCKCFCPWSLKGNHKNIELPIKFGKILFAEEDKDLTSFSELAESMD